MTALLGANWTPPEELDEFRIVRRLGSGAMGDVYLAHDQLLERPVAMKFVRVAGDDDARAQILEEARAIARLQHPNVVAVYRVAELAGHPYLVSEYVQGRTLDRIERPMPWRQVLDIALDLTRGLAAAHRCGVLHRDVKPSNAILTHDGRAKLLDFGLATILDVTSSEQFTAVSGLLAADTVPEEPTLLDAGPYLAGTPMYMAPEIWRGEPATRRSDLYSLGILLYELLAGQAPHRDVELAELGAVVQWRAARPLADVTTGVEPALAAIIDRLVARESGDRFASADAVVLALEACAAAPASSGSADSDPYHELAAFDAPHVQLSFGRSGEVRVEPFVVVGGDSGTGTSSGERMRSGSDLRSRARQLAETRSPDRRDLASREAALPAATARPVRWRWPIGAGVAAIVVTAAGVVGLAARARAHRELAARVEAQTSAATIAQAMARQIAAERDVIRSRALQLFDDHHWEAGEAAWTEVEATGEREEREYRSAAEQLDSALLLDPQRGDLREQAADLTFERMVRAERDRRADLVAELGSRLKTYGDHRHHAELTAAAHLELSVSPGGTRVSIERTGEPPQLVGPAPVPALTLNPGSLVLVFEARGRVTARLPVLLAHGETLAVQVALPAADTAPPGMLYVPAGRFLFGSAESTEARRQLFHTVPLHEISIPAYYIARHEVTFREWIEFLDALAPDERRVRSPHAVNPDSAAASVVLTELAPQHWELRLSSTTRTYRAETGERLRYERRARRADQDWMRFPVSGVSFEDATEFAAWLDRTGRVPGARLCDEYEWERAARGADARTFPSGSALGPDDANLDVTYGRDPRAVGPDEVGSHPASRSPVGAADMAGNVWEWMRSVQTPDAPVLRGGSWSQGELSARSMIRETAEPTLRSPLLGLRLCATPR